jgi:hypothetical protein
VESGYLLQRKVKSEIMRTLEGWSVEVHQSHPLEKYMQQNICHFEGLILRKKEHKGALTISHLKRSKG